jgi:hypothetical protein
VGRFGTVQLKDLACGSRIGVIQVVKVLPPSSDSQTSISHPVRLMLGRCAVHWIMTCCPGWRTTPAVGEISWAEYAPEPEAAVAVEIVSCRAQRSIIANNVERNPRVFILLFLSLITRVPNTNEILSKDITVTFLSSVPRLRDGVLRGDFYFCGSGNISLTVVPRPTLLSMMAEPPWRSTIDFTKARPSPAPSELRDDSTR